jgi:hypothetical protein
MMMFNRRLLGIATTVVLLGFLAPSTTAQATETTPATIKVRVDSNTARFWTGTVYREGRTYSGIPACQTSGCDRIRVTVDLPTWMQRKNGVVQVALRFLNQPNDSIGLYAYQGDRLKASSTGQIGSAQSMALPTVDATYDIYMSYQPFDPSVSSASVNYEGLAEFEQMPSAAPLRDMLPDLHILPQRYATFETPPPFFGDSAPDGASCFLSEIQEQGAQMCLRFGQAAENVGAGPVDVRYSVSATAPEDEVAASQRIYRSDGSYWERSAGTMHYHPAHQHYHFEGFSQSSLWPLDVYGNIVGSAPVATGRKNGFCMADTEFATGSWGAKGDTPQQTYPAPRCLDPIGQVSGRNLFKNGISAGWADEYAWVLPDQMIDVAGLPDGRYLLVTKVDADNKLLEADEANNCVGVAMTLTGLATATPSVVMAETIRPCPATA